MSSRGSARRAPAPRRGHTEPRLFTPPLVELTPETSWGFECIEFLENVLNWRLLPWQKWLYVHALEKDDAGTGFRYQTIVILIARQNGKTQWLKGLGLWKLYLDGAEKVLISAQNLEMAETTLAEAVADVKNNLLLRREYRRFSQTNGKYKLVLRPNPEDKRPDAPPREWRAAVSSRKGARSLSADLAILDELREHQNWLAWNAIVPTTQARPRSLVVCASNAGDATSIVLRSLRDGALGKILADDTDETQVGLFEWSLPDDSDYDNPDYWPMANPSMGYLPGFTERSLQGRLEAMHDNIAGFKTEYQCQWVDAMAPSVFPQADWKATTDPGSRRHHGSDVWTSVDVNFERTKAYISISATRADGLRHVETIAAQRGTDWVLPWYLDKARLVEDPRGTVTVGGKQYRSKFTGIVIQQRGAPATGLIEELEQAGIVVTPLGGADLTTAYGDFYDKLVEHRIMHRPSPALDAAVSLAQPKNIGDAWVIDRKKGDASAVIGCVQAEWAASRPPEEELRSAYENADLAVL